MNKKGVITMAENFFVVSKTFVSSLKNTRGLELKHSLEVVFNNLDDDYDLPLKCSFETLKRTMDEKGISPSMSVASLSKYCRLIKETRAFLLEQDKEKVEKWLSKFKQQPSSPYFKFISRGVLAFIDDGLTSWEEVEAILKKDSIIEEFVAQADLVQSPSGNLPLAENSVPTQALLEQKSLSDSIPDAQDSLENLSLDEATSLAQPSLETQSSDETLIPANIKEFEEKLFLLLYGTKQRFLGEITGVSGKIMELFGNSISLIDEFLEMKKEKGALSLENNSLKIQLLENKKESKSLKAELTELKAKIQDLKSITSTLEKENASLSADIIRLQKDPLIERLLEATDKLSKIKAELKQPPATLVKTPEERLVESLPQKYLKHGPVVYQSIFFKQLAGLKDTNRTVYNRIIKAIKVICRKGVEKVQNTITIPHATQHTPRNSLQKSVKKFRVTLQRKDGGVVFYEIFPIKNISRRVKKS